MPLKLEDMMPNNNFITKMTEKRRRRKAMKKAAKVSPQGADHDEHSESSSCGDRRVRFGRDSVAVYELPPVHSTDEEEHEQHRDEEEIRSSRKAQLWYNKAELNEQFLLDLQAHVRDQILKSQPGYNSATDSASSSTRGLEFHFYHNQRRKEKAEAYVPHIVEKAQSIRKEVGLSTPITIGNRKWDRRMAVRSLTKNPPAAQEYSDQIQEYCSQYTWMARDLAIGVAVADAAEARAVYEEEDHAESSDCSAAVSGGDKSTTSSSFVHTNHNCEVKKPVSYNAKSA